LQKRIQSFDKLVSADSVNRHSADSILPVEELSTSRKVSSLSQEQIRWLVRVIKLRL
jgi:hypothetical protein